MKAAVERTFHLFNCWFVAIHVCFMRFAVWPNCQSYIIPVKYSSPVDNSLLYLFFTLPNRQRSCQWMQMTYLTRLSFQAVLVHDVCQEMAYLDVSLKSNHIRDQKYYSLISNQFFHHFHVDALHMYLFLSVMQMCNFGCWEVRAGDNSRGKKPLIPLLFLLWIMPHVQQLILWSRTKK